MSVNYSNSKVGFNVGQVSFNGLGIFYDRAKPGVDFANRLNRPNAKLVLLVSCEIAYPLRSIRQQGLNFFDDAPSVGTVTALRYNNGEDLIFDPTLGGGLGITPGRWYLNTGNNAIVFNPVRGDDVMTDTYTAIVGHYFSSRPKTFRDTPWMPRINTIPGLSLRVPDQFAGLAQIGGGRLTLNNEDGYFDDLRNLNWDAGEVRLELGVDLPDDEMDEADYMPIGVWRVESHSRNDKEFTLVLRERKTVLEAEIPFALFNREDFPRLPEATVGQPIPLAYGRLFGRKPVLIDPTLKKFKVAAHRIRSLDRVRIRQSIEEGSTSTVTSWVRHLLTSAHYTLESDEVLGVAFDGDDLTKRNSIAAVVANVGSWYQEGGVLYIQPPTGETITSGTYSVTTQSSFELWTEIPFASRDLARAEFTLGDEWDRDADVSVDFEGRVLPNDDLMENAADIVVDLLDYIGETVFDAKSFDDARRRFHIGYDRYDREVTHLAPSLYLDEMRPASEYLQDLCKLVGAFLFVDLEGRWRFTPFLARQAQLFDYGNGRLLRRFDDTHLGEGSFSEEVVSREIFARVQVAFAERVTDGWSQFVSEERQETILLHNLGEMPVKQVEAAFSKEDDARYHAQRLLTTAGQPLTLRRATLPWPGFLIVPGDQVRVSRTRGDVDEVMDVIEASHDFTAKKVNLVLSDRQSWKDTFGWWDEDAQNVTLPAFDIWYKADGQAVDDQEPVIGLSDFAPNSGDQDAFLDIGEPNWPAQLVYYRTNMINGHQAWQFHLDADRDSRLFLADWLPVPVWTAGEMFCVLRAAADPPAGPPAADWIDGVFHDFGSSGLPSLYSSYADGKIYEGWGSTTRRDCGVPPVPLTEWRLYNVASGPAEYTVRLDNTVLFTSATNTVGWRGNTLATLGSRSVSGTKAGFNGWIAEYIVLNRVLTTSERAAVVQYLSTKYGLAIVAAASPLPSWDPNWTDAQVVEARLNHGYWHGPASEGELAHPTDGRSYRASRWW